MQPAANLPEPIALAGTTDTDYQALLERLCDLTADIVFFPVRHHSPMGACMIRQLIAQVRPATVLIEGPSDYNDYCAELLLDHQLPIAIYSYFRTEQGHSSGAYYPFCDYSPEWVALRTAAQYGASARFIDMPWSAMAGAAMATHRYADMTLRQSRYVGRLCERLEAEDLDDLWDKLIESPEHMTLSDYCRRVHALCLHIRLWEETVHPQEQCREAFMAAQIQQAKNSCSRIVVVTGGFHSSALAARLGNLPCPGVAPEEPADSIAAAPSVAGIALTSYSYARLDSLTGYDAGMPSPGFYDHVWQQRQQGESFTHQPLLVELIKELRELGQIVSTADLIAVETSARALAAVRGRQHVWRRDLLDAVTSALLKEELQYGCASPFLSAVQAVLRGRRRGRLAVGTRMPPLVLDIQEQLQHACLFLQSTEDEVKLNLLKPDDLARSQLLHRLHLLNISGIVYGGGSDFLRRNDLTSLWENWRLRWTPEFDSACIEASRYGISVVEAATARLQEIAQQQAPGAVTAAALLVQAAQAGIQTLSATLLADLQRLIAQEGDFAETAGALGHLLFLYCFDEVFGTTGHGEIGWLVQLAFERSLWLLELLGRSTANDRLILEGLQTLLQGWQRTASLLALNDNEFFAVLQRVEHDAHKPPSVRGAAAGILWTLASADAEHVLADLLLFSDPNDLGDFLTGLFALAREVAQQHPQLMQTLDRLLLQFSSEEFQQALPALRLAFTFFTPREKHHMLTTLFESLGIKSVRPLAAVSVDAATAAAALAIDERIFAAIRRYGLEEEPFATEQPGMCS